MLAMDPLVGKLVEMLVQDLITESKHVFQYRSQLEKLEAGLRNVKACLADTQNLKSNLETQKVTLMVLRELIYEADDVLIDVIIKDEYQKADSCSVFSPFDITFRYEIGKRLKDLNSKMEMTSKDLTSFLRPQEPSTTVQQVARYSSQDFDSSEIIGLENDVKTIKEWILWPDEEILKVGIVGMGGLGKTTIAQKVMNDREVRGYFEKMIWVSVSQNFDEERIMRSMLEQLQLGQEGLGSDKGQMLRRIHQLLEGKSFLIVMDDVWNINFEWWRRLSSNLPTATEKSSCFIVTTRNEDVAFGVDSYRIHRPKVLNPEESWSLFSKFAFSVRKGICPNSHFEKVGKEIVEKCRGLPLAIKTIGASLAPKIHSLTEWKKTRDDFHELTTRGQTSSVLASLQLSYDELPSLLKTLLLCFSIYPEDSVIHSEQLIHWWIGEGLIRSTNSRTATELGFEYLSELAGRCLVEVVQQRGYDRRVYSCKMHDLVRDLTIMIAQNESFCGFERGRQKWTPDSLWFGIINEADANSLKSSLKLRALLLMSRSEVPLQKYMKPLLVLRVLDLSHSKLENVNMEELLCWICSLKRLAVLNLSGAAGLKVLPRSIRKLRNLRILVLSGCNNLVKLHQSIIMLKMLMILDLGFCGLQYLPCGLAQLSHMQELSGFKVVGKANKRSCQVLELQQLTELQVLRLNLSDESELSEEEGTIFLKLEKLKVLAIDMEDVKVKNVLPMLDQLTPPAGLQELYLRHYPHKTLPKWVQPGKLPNLQYLCIENGDLDNIHLSLNSESVWTVEGLCLKFLPNLELDWKDLMQKMPLLSYLEVSHCFNLKNFPCPVNKPGVWRKHRG
ncbi:disease resistance RPP13-like protein 4 isoform X2 [Tripterygium wilfordii]|nr:disease resistance RPP13-like protein 4 isoform X2 [Tripterygium wilfordii]XP_038691946.1 disease resistance RPP13-like protein 4 isoform X2 [Tripterygium wilfordii]